jgi:hypothetical protein
MTVMTGPVSRGFVSRMTVNATTLIRATTPRLLTVSQYIQMK